jgi:hypothetical protein
LAQKGVRVTTTEIILTYVGSVLIAMEFVRKTVDLQALMGMLVGWPVSSFLGGKPTAWDQMIRKHGLQVSLRLILSLILGLVTLPLTIAFHVIWGVVLVLNSFHNLVNRLYLEGKKRYRPLYLPMIGITLVAHRVYQPERYAKVSEKKVMAAIEKRDLPILPIIGLILISIAFVLYFV